MLLGYGCEDILKNAVHHFVPPGGTLLVPSASWWYYRAIVDEVAGRIREFPLTESEHSYHYDANRLLAAREAVRLVHRLRYRRSQTSLAAAGAAVLLECALSQDRAGRSPSGARCVPRHSRGA